MGYTQTNCYIVTIDAKDIIIDPGIDATDWVIKHTTNPIAILNTHGHFDHVWSNAELKNRLNIPIYIPKDDAFMLEEDPLLQGTPPSKPDHLVSKDEELNIKGIKVKYRHFPGHTPGCSIIEIEDVWFSGDFLFQNSIGRWDFPSSSAEDMLASLKKVLTIEEDFTLYPGHGLSSTLKTEQKMLPYWIKEVERR
jgi:glyoxylase-like metal-dependent hydrolase (beta-lactamase superfamily II)